ncbi:MAG: alpha/beta fold hydrolase [Pseudomonadota bacterium]
MRYDPPFHRSNGLWPAIIAFVALAVFPFVWDDNFARHMLVLVMVYAIVAASWDLTLGFGGLFNFAHVALFATGVYAYGILAKTLGVSPWLAIPLGGVAAMAVAAIMTAPVLRLDGIYMILVTLAFAQLLLQLVVSQSDITGGTSGMVTLPSLKWGGYSFVRDGKIGYYYVALGLLAACLAFLQWIVRAPLGRAIRALRDNKYYAISRGVPEARTRLLAMLASALPTGMAGAFYGSYVRVASPDAFGIGFLTLLLSILLLGGAGTLWGPVVAAFAVTLLSESIAGLGPWREILIAVLIVAVMAFYPGGLWAAIQELREGAATALAQLRAIRNRRVRASERARLTHGARETMVSTPHGRIAVADGGGDGPPLMFIHGNSACKEAFSKQFEAFGPAHRVVAFDLPGHGVSDNADPEASYNIPAYAEVAEEVIDALGLDRPVVFGWSLGGYVALELGAREARPLAGLAIAGTSPLALAPDDVARGYDPDSHFVFAGRQFLTRAEQKIFADEACAPRERGAGFMHRNLPRTDGRARPYMITKFGVVNWPRQMRMLAEGRVPFAILNGDDDPFLNHGYIRGLRYGDIFRGAPFDIEGGQHAPFFNEPDAFNAAFAAFVADCLARSRAAAE